jgi:hypothetical protein
MGDPLLKDLKPEVRAKVEAKLKKMKRLANGPTEAQVKAVIAEVTKASKKDEDKDAPPPAKPAGK